MTKSFSWINNRDIQTLARFCLLPVALLAAILVPPLLLSFLLVSTACMAQPSLIELARFFKSIETTLPMKMRFVALGAEEVAGLGSRMYVKRHGQDLGNCELVFNMDVLGGSGNTVIEMMGGVRNVPEVTGKSRLPVNLRDVAWEGINGRWRLLPPPEVLSLLMGTTNYPDLLVKAIEESVEELGYEITPTGPLGGDSMFFAEAGIVATSIGVMGNVTNSPLDTIEHINKGSLKKAGDIVAAVVMKTIRDSPTN